MGRKRRSATLDGTPDQPPWEDTYGSVFRLVFGGALVDGPFAWPAYQTPLDPGGRLDLRIQGVVLPGVTNVPIPTPGVPVFGAAIDAVGDLIVTVDVDGLLPSPDYDVLFDAFIAFKQALDAAEAPPSPSAQALLAPGGTAVACARVASNVPLPIGQLARFVLAFDPQDRWIDLAPGMRLDVVPQTYSAYDVSPGGFDANSWAGSASLRVQRRGAELVLSSELTTRMPATFSGTSDFPQAVGGLADLDQQVLTGRWLRVIWPSEVSPAVPAYPPEEGWVPKTRVMVLAAATYADLVAGTKEIFSNPPKAPTNAVFRYFAGRSSATLRLPVRYQGAPMDVPIGTTVADLLAQTIRALPAEVEATLERGDAELNLVRWDQPAQKLDDFKDSDKLGPFELDFDLERPPGWTRASTLDLPLLPGDDVYLDPERLFRRHP